MKRRLLLMLPLALFLALGVFLYQGLSINPFERESALMAREFPDFELSTLKTPSAEWTRTRCPASFPWSMSGAAGARPVVRRCRSSLIWPSVGCA